MTIGSLCSGYGGLDIGLQFLSIGLSWSAQLKALGNGVVPQQAALALRLIGVAA